MIITIAGGLFVSAAIAAKYALESALGAALMQGMQSALGLFAAHPTEAVHLLADTIEIGDKIKKTLAKPHKHTNEGQADANTPEPIGNGAIAQNNNNNNNSPRYGA